MTQPHGFETDLFSLFDDDAHAPIPAGGLERLQAAIANHKPRPAHLAGLGSRWPAGRIASRWPLGALRASVLALRPSVAVLLLLLMLAMVGTAALVGGRLLERPPDPEKLLYGLDGDIFLADADGSNRTRVAEGATLFDGSPWAPNGRHFLSFDTARSTAVIREPGGDEVATLANRSFAPWWSPDSTRLQAWAQTQLQINIYGIDGALQTQLPLPDRYTRAREIPGFWAPDGRSIWVWIVRDQTSGPCTSRNGDTLSNPVPPLCPLQEVWKLPIDGSPAQQVAAEDLLLISFMPSVAADGSRLAFAGRDSNLSKVYVSNADGTEARAVVRPGQDSGGDSVLFPIWSPSGQDLAYLVGDHLKVVNVGTGMSRTLATAWMYAGFPPHSWSADGERIMFSKERGPTTQDGSAVGDLWTVGIDGGEPALLVEGATRGAWQP